MPRPILKHSKQISFQPSKTNDIIDDKLYNLKILTKEELCRRQRLNKMSNNIINFNSKNATAKLSTLHRVMYNCEINKEIIQLILKSTNDFFSRIEQEFHLKSYEKLMSVYKHEFLPKLKEFLIGNRNQINKININNRIKIIKNEAIDTVSILKSNMIKNKSKMRYYFTLR